MSFAAPALLFGLLFGLVPIAVHLIGRRQAPTLPFAPYAFLAEVVQRLARREKLRQLLLLLLRIAAVLLLAFALATPGKRNAAVLEPDADQLIILDASPSMAYRLSGETLLDRAKKQTEALLASRSGGQALVVVAGDEALPLTATATADRNQLRDAVSTVSVATHATPLAAAVRRGLEILGDRPVALSIVSDLSGSAFVGTDTMTGHKVQSFELVDAAHRERPEALANVAISALRTERLSEGGYVVTVTVRNFAAAPAQCELRLVLDGSAKARGFLSVAPGGAGEKQFTLSDLAPGDHRGEIVAASEGDGFVDDDKAPIALEVFAEPKVLLVDGAPRSVSYRDELFYLERALQSAEPPVQFVSVTADDFASVKLDDYGVIVLANAPAPSPQVAAQLTEFVQHGGGLLIGLGDNVDFEKYNAVLGEVLPAHLRDQWAVADPHAADAPEHALGITNIDWTHPALRRFEPAVAQAFLQSRTYRHFFVEAADLAKTAVLLRFSSGAPALIERNHVALWLSTLDRDYSDLAIRPPFSPLMAQLVRYLGGALRSVPDEAATAGQRLDVTLPVGLDRAYARPLAGGPNQALVGDATIFSAPGLYGLFAKPTGGQPIRGTLFTVLASLDESDFTPVVPAELARRWGASDEAHLATVDASRSPVLPTANGDFTSYAHLALAALVVAFSLQTLVARRG